MGGTRKSGADCRTVVQKLSNYIDGRVDDRLRDRIEAHLERCNQCATLLETTRKMLKMLGNSNSFLSAIEKHAKEPDTAARLDALGDLREGG